MPAPDSELGPGARAYLESFERCLRTEPGSEEWEQARFEMSRRLCLAFVEVGKGHVYDEFMERGEKSTQRMRGPRIS